MSSSNTPDAYSDERYMNADQQEELRPFATNNDNTNTFNASNPMAPRSPNPNPIAAGEGSTSNTPNYSHPNRPLSSRNPPAISARTGGGANGRGKDDFNDNDAAVSNEDGSAEAGALHQQASSNNIANSSTLAIDTSHTNDNNNIMNGGPNNNEDFVYVNGGSPLVKKRPLSNNNTGGIPKEPYILSMPSGIVMFLMMFACVLSAMGAAGSQYFGDTMVLRQTTIAGGGTTIEAIPATVHLYLFKALFVNRETNTRLYSQWYTRDTAEAYDGPTSSGIYNGETVTFIIPDGYNPDNERYAQNEYTSLGSCVRIYDRLTTAFAFAIMSCIASFVAGMFALVRICMRTSVTKYTVVISCFTALVFLIIAFILPIVVFKDDWCLIPSPSDAEFRINFGLALLITSCGLALISFIWALVTK